MGAVKLPCRKQGSRYGISLRRLPAGQAPVISLRDQIPTNAFANASPEPHHIGETSLRMTSRPSWRSRFTPAYYGWVVVSVAALVSFCQVSFFNPVLGVFIEPLSDEFGWSSMDRRWDASAPSQSHS